MVSLSLEKPTSSSDLTIYCIMIWTIYNLPYSPFLYIVVVSAWHSVSLSILIWIKMIPYLNKGFWIVLYWWRITNQSCVSSHMFQSSQTSRYISCDTYIFLLPSGFHICMSSFKCRLIDPCDSMMFPPPHSSTARTIVGLVTIAVVFTGLSLSKVLSWSKFEEWFPISIWTWYGCLFYPRFQYQMLKILIPNHYNH